MSSHKLNISLESSTLLTLKERAAQLAIPVSHYIGRLVEADAKSARDLLAAEGYRLLSSDTLDFAEAALPLAAETWGDERGPDA